MIQFKDFEKLMKTYPANQMNIFKRYDNKYGTDQRLEILKFDKQRGLFIVDFQTNPFSKGNNPIKILIQNKRDQKQFYKAFNFNEKYSFSSSRQTNKYIAVPCIINKLDIIFIGFISKSIFMKIFKKYALSTLEMIYKAIQPYNGRKMFWKE